MTKVSPSRRARRLRRKRGRPPGSYIPLAADPKRFAMVAWFALNEMGIGRYSAAYLATVLVDSNEKITIERVHDVLVSISVAFSNKRTTLVRHSDRMVRKVAQVFPRLSEDERNWVAGSAACIVGLVQFTAENNIASACGCLDVLAELGWSAVIEQLRQRIGSALQSNLPPVAGDLSAAARRLLERARKIEPKNGSGINKF